MFYTIKHYVFKKRGGIYTLLDTKTDIEIKTDCKDYDDIKKYCKENNL